MSPELYAHECVLCERPGEQSRTPSLAGNTWTEKRRVRLVLNANRAALWGGGRVCRNNRGGRDSASLTCSDSSMPAAAAGLRRVGCVGAVSKPRRGGRRRGVRLEWSAE